VDKINKEIYYDENLYVSIAKKLDRGATISPQFLILIDIFYSYYLTNNSYFKVRKYKDTLSTLHGGKQDEREEILSWG
jgi:hypothetical protein